MAKKVFTRKRTSKQNPPISWLGLLAIILFIVICIFAILIYQYKHNKLQSETLTAYFSQTENWFKEHTSRFQKKLKTEKPVKTKTVAHKEELEPVHFEFYTALPNMQMGVREVALSSPDEKAKAIVTKTISTKTKNIVVVSQDELEHEFSDKLRLKNYIVQMGIFQTMGAANRYQKTISTQGFDVSIVKTKVADKEVYRVQLGPFLQKDQAKLTQNKLQKKGISAIILLSRENS